MSQTREEIYELTRIAEKQHTWTALQPTTRTYRNIEMGTPLQNLHAAVRQVENLTASQWAVLSTHPTRIAFNGLIEAARKVGIEPTLAQEIQQILTGEEWDSDTCSSIADVLRRFGYHVADPDEPTLAPFAPSEVIAAFMEVQKYYPDVESVVYDIKGNWCYRDVDGDPLTFGAEISTDILGLGADAAPKPYVYFLVEG